MYKADPTKGWWDTPTDWVVNLAGIALAVWLVFGGALFGGALFGDRPDHPNRNDRNDCTVNYPGPAGDC